MTDEIDHRRPPMPHWDADAHHCRWCGEAGAYRVPSRSQYAQVSGHWHEACLTAYGIAVSSKAQRYFVEQRDLGLCACCGANAERAMLRAIADDKRKCRPFFGWRTTFSPGHIDDQFRCRAPVTYIYPLRLPDEAIDPLPPIVDWQADHIVPLWSVDRALPIADLLRFWTIENLQTLCTDCHAAKSAREAAERAARRRLETERASGPTLLDLMGAA